MGRKRRPEPRTDIQSESHRGLCPFCRAGFLQPERMASAHHPAWVCDNPDCGYRVIAADLIRASKAHSAHARRKLMKARAVIARATRGVAKTRERLNGRKRSK